MSLNRMVPDGPCPCPKKECPRYEKCDECRNNHYKKNKLPYCERKN
jgi:hypothetical protein